MFRCRPAYNLESSSSRATLLYSVSVGIPVDYCSLVGCFALTEAVLLKRLWNRWDRAHYRHQFDHNIGIGNLREVTAAAVEQTTDKLLF